MIELRWKIDPLVKCDPDNNGIYGIQRTLQFRIEIWTDWQDVPEVPTGQLQTVPSPQEEKL